MLLKKERKKGDSLSEAGERGKIDQSVSVVIADKYTCQLHYSGSEEAEFTLEEQRQKTKNTPQ